MLHAVIGRSPHGHARIVSANVHAAEESPGVEAVLTSLTIADASSPFRPGRYSSGLKAQVPEYAMAIGRSRYVGEPVSAVAAVDRATAEDALALIDMRWEPLPAVVSTQQAISPDAPVLFEEFGTNAVWENDMQYGDIASAFANADVVVRDSLAIHRYSSTPLEPFACIASYEQSLHRLTLWCNTQAPEVVTDAAREALGVDDVRLITPDIGGGFGQKIHLIRKYAVIVGLLAIRTGRPVKWIEDRTEHLMAGGHACAQEFETEAAVSSDGSVLGLRIRETDDVGGSLSTATIHFTNKLNNLFNTYCVPSIAIHGTAVVTNKCPVVPNRGIGKPAMCYVWERMMDRIAGELGIDPVEIRRKNIIAADQFPYITPSGNVYDSGDYAALIDRAVERIGYAALREEQVRAREVGRYLGIGIAMGIEPGGRNLARDLALLPEVTDVPGSGGTSGATIRVERGGFVVVTLGTPSCGQAHETTAAQVAGEVLCVPTDRIRVVTTFDTNHAPWGGASTNSGNNFHLYDIGAVHGAATRLRDKLIALTASLCDTDPTNLVMEPEGRVVAVEGRSVNMDIVELARVAYNNTMKIPDGMDPGLQATFMYRFPFPEPFGIPDEMHRIRAQFTFPAAVHFAVVEADADTGRVDVLRYLIVGDNGTIINPDVVDGQIHGSAVHGISVALGEGYAYDAHGQLLTRTLRDYGKATTLNMPSIEVEHLGVPSPFTPLGQKAAGEGAAIPSPAAIASAVEDALSPLGVQVRNLPLGPEQVWRLITNARQASES
jgi:2-furoyl-CoA dehydrogenase large subunit